jgi:dienelactone hydrolase
MLAATAGSSSASHMAGGGSGIGGATLTVAHAGSGATGEAVAGAPAPAAGSGSPAVGDCGANMLDVPDDLHMRGPWDAAVRTLKAGRVTLELFYPAPPGSGAGKPEATYNHSDWLPEQEKSKTTKGIAPAAAIGGKLYRDLPLDETHGPYPVVIFIHGTASMRAASISTNAHWASRGFVVAVADYPGLGLTDQLNAACGYPQTGDQDVEGDVHAQIMALSAATGDYAFLQGHIDMSRLALGGHSQGACMSATLSTIQNVRLVMPISGSTQVSPAPDMTSIMWIAGMDDTVIGYNDSLLGNIVCPANPLPASSDTGAYDASPGPPEVTKRIAGIRGGGHLSVTDLCQVNSLGNTDLEQMHMDNICGVDSAVIIGLPALFDCGTIDWKMGVDAVNYVSTAALEETLLCRNRKPQFDALQMNVPAIGDYQHAP